MLLPDDLATIARMANPDALRHGGRFPSSDAGQGHAFEDDALLLRAVIASATCFEDEPATPTAVVAA